MTEDLRDEKMGKPAPIRCKTTQQVRFPLYWIKPLEER